MKDWSDFSSAIDGTSAPVWSDQNIGIGDGATVNFQLVKNYTSGAVTHTRTITKPISGSVTVGVSGTQLGSGFSVNLTTGLVTFAAPPGAGQSVTAGFQFDVPVRFDTDQLALTTENYVTYKADIPIVEVRV